MHSELNFRPVQILTGHVIHNSPYDIDQMKTTIVRNFDQYVFLRKSTNANVIVVRGHFYIT